MDPFTVGALLIGSAGAISGLYYYLSSDKEAQKALALHRVFKTPLDVVAKDPATGLPPIVLRTITYLESGEGIRHQGLFRQSGCKRTLREMAAKIDAGEQVSFEGVDNCTVGDILKHYLRELPEPLFPFAYYKDIITLEGNFQRDHDIGAWREGTMRVIASLSPAHRTLIQALFTFLAAVAAQEKSNWMGAGNLATIFAPSVIYSPPPPPTSSSPAPGEGIAPDLTEVLVGTWTCIQFVVKCIEHADTIARVQGDNQKTETETETEIKNETESENGNDKKDEGESSLVIEMEDEAEAEAEIDADDDVIATKNENVSQQQQQGADDDDDDDELRTSSDVEGDSEMVVM